jgi:hypothetical protein
MAEIKGKMYKRGNDIEEVTITMDYNGEPNNDSTLLRHNGYELFFGMGTDLTVEIECFVYVGAKKHPKFVLSVWGNVLIDNYFVNDLLDLASLMKELETFIKITHKEEVLSFVVEKLYEFKKEIATPLIQHLKEISYK